MPQPQHSRQNTNFLALAVAAFESIVMGLRPIDEGRLYFISADRFVDLMYDEAMLAASETPPVTAGLNGQEFSDGIDRFVEDALQNPKVKGLVPLTDETRKLLTGKFNLRPIVFGGQLNPEYPKFDMYWR